MKPVRTVASHVIDAPSAVLYDVIRDYKGGHAAILPRPVFQEMVVTKGGYGAGTELRITTKAMGVSNTFHQVASEPEPGRKIVETTIETGFETSFTFEPLTPNQTRVTITCDLPVKEGLLSGVEAVVTRFFGERLFRTELENLAAYVKQQKLVPSAG